MHSLGIWMKYLSLKINISSLSLVSSQSHQLYRRTLWESVWVYWRRRQNYPSGSENITDCSAGFITNRSIFSDARSSFFNHADGCFTLLATHVRGTSKWLKMISLIWRKVFYMMHDCQQRITRIYSACSEHRCFLLFFFCRWNNMISALHYSNVVSVWCNRIGLYYYT